MGEQYFEADPSSAADERETTVSLWGTERRYTTSGGVFAHGALDKATALLLQHSTPPLSPATVLDLGCGWGPIACSLAGEGLDVWAVDVNERALDLTRRNAERHALTVRTARPDEVPADVTFDAIWSNPPIRIGKDALHELLSTWLPRLSRSGEARLVVGKNLGADSLQRWLDQQGFPTRREASAKGFRILSVTRP